MTDPLFTRDVSDALGAPFPDDEIEFLPRASSGGMALGLPYIDARSVMRRLDAAVGPGNWSYDFDVVGQDGKQVRGRLTVYGVTKCDAGEASTEDEVLKSAVSDALKRCAVHFGIGRYLYYLPRIWAPYDPQKRRFIEPPRLDPAAVRKALAICGISAAIPNQGGPGRQRAEQAAQSGETGRTYANGAVTSGAGAQPEEAPKTGLYAEPDKKAPPQVNDRRGKPVNAVAASELICSGAGCGSALTKGQRDVSVRAFGTPLCPACQKNHARQQA